MISTKSTIISASIRGGQLREVSMQKREKFSRLQWLDQYQASKTVLFWACAGSVIAATGAAPSTTPRTTDDRKAAGLCAEELAKREIPRAGQAAQIDDGAAVAR